MMATQVNPFLASFDRGERRTLAEIEAANKISKSFRGFSQQPTQPDHGLARVAEWLSNQENQDIKEDLIEFNTFQSNRRTEVLSLHESNESTGQQPRRRTSRSGTTSKPSRPRQAPVPSQRDLSSTGSKRKASELEVIEDCIVVKPLPRLPMQGSKPAAFVDLTIESPPSSARSGRKPAAFVDLTGDSRQKRRASRFGNQDDDVIIIDSPAPEIRKGLRSLVLGRPNGQDIRPEKRPKQTHTRPAPALEQPARQRSPEEAAAARIAPDANAINAAVLLQSVESTTYFFTLATEIRDKIYRHLLVSPKPIHVQHLWTKLARRSSRRTRGSDDSGTTIDTRILSVCHRTAMEGIRVLYSENCFLYMLRDPDDVKASSVGVRRSQRVPRNAEDRAINLAKYGHLIRHMAIELEPNRTGTAYEKLMFAALETLAPTDTGLPLLPSPPRPLCGPIHLHTLTITVSPLLQSSHRSLRSSASGSQDVVTNEGRTLSMANFFSRGAPILKALQRINADFLRINVHVNSDSKSDYSGAAPWSDSSEDEEAHSDTADDADDNADDDDDDNNSIVVAPPPKRRHLETTIDLRYLPRHMETLRREGPMGHLWENDVLMQERHYQKGLKATETLKHLRQHIEDACLKPEEALRGDIWEDHGAAERRRSDQRAKADARFDADAYDTEDEEDEEDRRVARGMKSLIISIDRVGGELRAYRA